MNKRFTKAATAVALAGALAFGAPIAAFADPIDDDPYTPNTSVSGPSAITIGGTGTYSFAANVFEPGETVTFTLTGEFALQATLATIVKSAVETQSASKPANADGSVDVSVTLPPNATGVYTLNVFSASTTVSPISITAAAAGGATGSGGSGAVGTDGSALPETGTDGELMLGLWVGGGALLLAGGAIVVATTVRRQRQNAA